MSFNNYYQSELTALRQLGSRFAERNPALAPFLGQAGQDPDVERLLEGFAFLTGRLRQKLDDELPELTHSLMQLLWPNYMRPFPAVSMLQFEPLEHSGSGIVVARGTPVESVPVEDTVCHFRTCYETAVLPLRLSAVNYSANGSGVLLGLRLDMNGDGHIGSLELNCLRLHFAGEPYVSQTLYLGLMRNLEKISLTPLDAEGNPFTATGDETVSFNIPVDRIKAVGFAEEEALVPYPLNTFRGYRYLQEYFVFKEKYLFVDVSGLEVIHSLAPQVLEKVRSVELSFDITKNEIQRLRPTLQNIKLYCTPIVNLFEQDALPVRLEGTQDEYRLLPGGHDSRKCGIFSVDKVTGWQPGGLGYQEFVLFESFEHDPSFDVQQPRPYYSIRQHPSPLHEGLDTYLSFDGCQTRQHETLSVELTCTHQDLPVQIAAGGICRPCEETPDFLKFRNITPATRSFAPPLHKEFLWRVISNMSLNYLSLNNVSALKCILETYDFPRYYDQQAERVSKQLLNGLKSIRHEPVDHLYRGLPVRGLKTELLIDTQGCAGEGGLFVFASVLNEFFALYASLNSFHELHVRSTQGEVYEWTPRMGLQPLI
ncbi:type VI secretion system baseplate subunit TssF [Pseudomonas cichorii]|uniref:type VI secretion system baseplate subunit TssF n=1 Tax=Pseudomonas cichorii TaxID=36746 RepID=UPI0018E5F8B4|nr:type VI secretion system baseplate subunit TssF [Pseudomonas cichorii]MBI6853002.1 type VI secretion system baseplate subunit TssF [Pseudomonas cichorii]